jgi:hypothetical protein
MGSEQEPGSQYFTVSEPEQERHQNDTAPQHGGNLLPFMSLEVDVESVM